MESGVSEATPWVSPARGQHQLSLGISAGESNVKMGIVNTITPVYRIGVRVLRESGTSPIAGKTCPGRRCWWIFSC